MNKKRILISQLFWIVLLVTTIEHTTLSLPNNFIYSFLDTTHAVHHANTYEPIPLDVDTIVNGWSHSTTSPANEQFICNQSGVYLITYDAHIQVPDSDARIVFRVINNGAQISGSTKSIIIPHLTTTSQVIMVPVTKSFLVQLHRGNVLIFQWRSTDDRALLISTVVEETRIPSFAVTISRTS